MIGKFVANPASDKQKDFVSRLVQEANDLGSDYSVDLDSMTKREASEHIDHLLHELLPVLRYSAKPAAPKVEEGFYVVDGTPVKVQIAYHGSGNPYAKMFDAETKKFEYAPGLVRRITPEMKMSLEQAKDMSALYGVCIRCGTVLTAEKSIEQAMGPVCIGKF